MRLLLLSILLAACSASAADIRIREYEKRGIEYVVTGDVSYERYEAFRQRFNSAMEHAIVARFGTRIFDEIDTAIDVAIKKARRRK